MTTHHVRRVATVRASGADYTSRFELRPAPEASAAAWARTVFECPPPLYRAVLALGWRLGLGLRLADGPARVLGWRLTTPDGDTAELTADGRRVIALNRVQVSGDAVEWSTVVRYRGLVGRLVWTLAAPAHHVTLPWLLRRAATRLERTT